MNYIRLKMTRKMLLAISLSLSLVLPTVVQADEFYYREQLIGGSSFTTDEITGGGVGGGTIEEPAPEPEPEPEPATVSIVLNSATLPDAALGMAYSYDLSTLATVTNATVSDLNWSILTGSLPLGMTIDPITGVVSGTASETGSNAFDVTASFDGVSDVEPYTITVGGVEMTITALTTGVFQTCALTATNGVKCWGQNGDGAVGDGTTVNRLTPVDVVGLTSGVSAISGGYGFTCALTTVGGVKCWGMGTDGQMGSGTNVGSLTPVDVPSLTSGVASISAGYAHACALMSWGEVKCWGNGRGLGVKGVQTATPSTVSGWESGVVQVSAGANHTCAVRNSGIAQCVGGLMGSALLGNGTTNYSDIAIDVTIGPVESLHVGADHTCAITTTGGVKCWGVNTEGRLGDGSTVSRETPVDVVGLQSGVAEVNGGNISTCALLTSGGAKCWGDNAYGQLGAVQPVYGKGKDSGTIVGYEPSTVASSSTPLDVGNVPGDLVDISSQHGLHACVKSQSSGLYCWGYGAGGQLGNGSTANSSAGPVTW